MKHIRLAVAFALALMLISAFTAIADENASSGKDLKIGDTFIFGAMEQNYDYKDDDHLLTLVPIEWIVVDKTADKALLLSKYVIEAGAFNSKREETTWEQSDIRKYLNGDFMDKCFSKAEKAAVLKTTLKNNSEKDREYKTNAGKDTEDYLFLLSYSEASRYFSKKERTTTGTTLAEKQGAKDVFSKNSQWWLRSPGKKQNQANYIMGDGDIYYNEVDHDYVGIRPTFWLDLSADFSTFDYEYYRKAEEAFAARNYSDVVDYCDTLLYADCGYSNALYLCFESYARLGLIYGEEREDYRAFINDEIFEFSDDDTNYYEAVCDILETCYESVQDCMAIGDYKKAISVLTYLGVYKDSIELLKECYNNLGIQVHYFSKEPVNAGTDNGYSKTNIIGKGDKHYNWSMGEFFMSGFTEVKNRTSDNPVFLKTVDDAVTLWFDLKQDVDALNGNKSLSIARDTNGYDQYFGTPEDKDFGRGMLIVRMTDYQNKKHDSQFYKDYLVATGVTGANTNVIFHEEGDYEVALDYEIVNSDIRSITNKYDNYRIYFKFSVRNGNCMIFPRDAKTNAELQNSSIAENGFYLDLAKSRYLNINVTRTEIVSSYSGVSEDIRFSKPASDGDKYTSPGIYTIKVSNEYTGESITKTIFVGSKELLDEYVANGFSMERLK